jgi:hypothetical protein
VQFAQRRRDDRRIHNRVCIDEEEIAAGRRCGAGVPNRRNVPQANCDDAGVARPRDGGGRVRRGIVNDKW